ncbi:MAG: type IV pilus secretin PilQ [Gammaproteobacteria bacterium]
MNAIYGRIMIRVIMQALRRYLSWCLLILIVQAAPVSAGDPAISSLEIVSQTGDKLLIEMEMTGPAIKPKVFHTDNPPRIALDFPGVKSALDKKMYLINQGIASSLYVAEAPDRIRIVVNLLESASFDINTSGNKVLLTLNNTKAITSAPNPVIQKTSPSLISQLIPQQTIKGIDFKRGDNGEGRLLISLANPNTIVNTKEEGGTIVLAFMNTYLPVNLTKRLDVTEFATPVKFIDAASTLNETTVTVTTLNSLYDYSLLQSEGLLTVDFRPLTSAEKEVLEATRNKYNGERLSLNFQEIDIRSVIAVLAEFTGQNVVAGDDVRGNVTVKLDDVPWDEALDFIMMTKGLEKYETGNVTLIAPVGKIKEYKEKQRATETVVEQLDPLITEYLKINYARAENFRNLLYGYDSAAFGSCASANSKSTKSSAASQATTQGLAQKTIPGLIPALAAGAAGANAKQKGSDQFSMLSPRGTVVVDARTNTLIVRETAKRLEEIKKLIRKLDIPVKQVMIESRIVIASNTFARELGVKFGAAKVDVFGSGINYGLGGGGTRSDLNEDGSVTTTIQDTLVDLAASNPYGALGMTLARGADYVLNLELSALQDQGRGQIISNPRVMTTDRCQAIITQGTSIPFQSSSANTGTNTQFIDALLSLDVTPQITPSGSINMDLEITRDDIGQLTVDGQPSIDTSSVKTNVLVNDGETVVLGGIYRGILLDTNNKVPFFAELPGIGFLFRKNIKQDDKAELLVFVTPKIVKDMLVNN